MKKSIIFLLALIVMVAGYVPRVFGAATVFNSLHNLGSRTPTLNSNFNGGKRYNFTGSTGSVCVFCHTPHGANLGVAAPLWNKGVGATDSYSAYESPTLDSTLGTAGPVGVSLACLSCHDGEQAMDSFINAVGSGLYNAAGEDYAYSWNSPTNSNNYLGNDKIGNAVTNLGRDLSNDHPISMIYAGKIGDATAIDPKYQDAVIIRSGKMAATNFVTESEIGRSMTSAKNTTDGDIRLFNIGTGYLVECASCHNPHGTDNGGESGVGIDDGTQTEAYPTFLQRPNTGSDLCRACHIK